MKLDLGKTDAELEEAIQKEARKERMGALWWLPNPIIKAVHILFFIVSIAGGLALLGGCVYFLLKGDKQITAVVIIIGVSAVFSVLGWLIKRA